MPLTVDLKHPLGCREFDSPRGTKQSASRIPQQKRKARTMKIRLLLPVIAAAITLMPASTNHTNPDYTFNGDTYTTIGNCIYDGDGNLTECDTH